MNEGSIWWAVQGVVVAAAAVALVYALWLLRAHAQRAREAAQAARESARLSLQAAELHVEAMQSARAAVEAAARVQRLAARPVFRVGLATQEVQGGVGRTPVVFMLRAHNVGHGTAVIDEVRLWVRGQLALAFGPHAQNLLSRIETDVFQRAVGASVQSLSGKLTVTPLTDETRAVEAAGFLDLLRVQVFAHNAEAVEQGLETLRAEVSYRDLDGALYTSAEQFRSLTTRG